MPEKGGPAPPRPLPPRLPITAVAGGGGGVQARGAPLKPKVAPPTPSVQHVKPLVIPSITWSSAPPPIAPRSFSTPPPPPPTPEVATEPPPSASPNIDLAAAAAFELEQERARADGVGRAHEVREEARALLLQTLEEALAPLHFAVRDLERRLVALEQRGPGAPAAPPPIAPPPPPAPSNSRSMANVLPMMVQAPSEPHAAPAAPPRVAAPPAPLAIPSTPRAPIDFDVPFDGARRKRRVIALFALFLVVVFGSLFGAAIMSWSQPH